MYAPYYVGLDIGTASLGGAVTDNKYNIIRTKGKDFWFVNEFDTADSAEARRTKRISRRALNRKQVRNGYIKNYFSDALDKEDTTFLARLENSKYYLEDKDIIDASKYTLFSDADYTDIDYYKEFKTMAHLRLALINDTVERNNRYTRLVFLAVLNIFEHRGHFLLNSDDSNIGTDQALEELQNLLNYLSEVVDKDFESADKSKIFEILSSKDYSRNTKKEKIAEILSLQKSDKKAVEYVKALCGLDSDARILFDIENESKIKVEFKSSNYEGEKTNIATNVGSNNYNIIERMKQIYDFACLQSVLKGYDYLSEARVAAYNKHAEDLAVLKKVYHKISQEAYDRMFRSSENGSYSAYVNSLFVDNKKLRRNMKMRSVSSFYDRIKNDLKNVEGDEVTYILEQIEKESFMPKQLTGDNGVIPNQVHRKELIKILDNASRTLTFLNVTDESGLTTKERIIQLFSFNIPYYVGPVDSLKTGWAIRKENGRVLPWNINDKIDMEATSQEFIMNLVRECTYLSGAKVLPKESLLYEEYAVLNIINAIRINDVRISEELKKAIYRDLFETGRKQSKKSICNYLKKHGKIEEEEQVTGIDTEITSYLSSWNRFYPIFGERLREDKTRELVEEIIHYGTVFGESKDLYRKKIEKYARDEKIRKEDVKRISGYKFTGWGKLSKEFLTLGGCDNETGEITNLISVLRNYSINLNEAINSKQFTFREELKNQKKELEKTLSTFEFEDLDDYYFSAPVRRMVWHTILSLKEITKVMKGAPEKIFIEMTRSEDEKVRTESREKQLLALYKGIEPNANHPNWKAEISAQSSSGKLNAKKVYLYYLQMGRDAYTGEEIDIERLFDDNLYDIDHIYPRHYVKDNNLLNNMVLVNKHDNELLKRDDYPLPTSISSNPKVRELWEVLHKAGLMNDEKYHRLTSRQSFTDEQKAEFISRQLVETAQGTKGVADIIKMLLPDTTIVYSKASNVSEFRQQFGFKKSRLVNDFHHAQDAYLNIIVGNVYYTKFTQNPLNFIKNDLASNPKKNHYNLSRMFDWRVERGSEVAWIPEADGKDNGSIGTVRKMMSKNTPIIVRTNYVQKGALFDAQPISKHAAKPENYAPLKKNGPLADVKKYGGYASMNPAYFIFVEHGKDGKRKKTFDAVQGYYAIQIHTERDLEKFCSEKLGMINPRIIKSLIKKDSMIKFNGFYLYIKGMDSRKNVEFASAVPFKAKDVYVGYIKTLEGYITKSKNKKETQLPEEVTAEKNLWLYELIEEKHKNGIYKKHPKSLGSTLERGKATFKLLGLTEQVEILYNLIMYTSFEPGTFSLDKIGGPKEVGRIRISGNMTDAEELKIINRSVTGIYQTEQNLLSC